MQFAYQPRKASRPAQSSSVWRSYTLLPYLRRATKKQLAWLLLGSLLLWLLFRGSSRGRSSSRPGAEYIPPNTPPVVLVTVMDPMLGPTYANLIRENRELYAAKHGYTTFFTNTTAYDLTTSSSPTLSSSPKSWAKIPAVRHAMSTHKHSTFFFFLSATSLIMNPTLTVESHITRPSRLKSLMLKDHPVVPPNSVIHTFSNLKGEHINFILTQDSEGLCQDSFIIKKGEWAKFFLDSWFDPLYRTYNFQRAEGHALEHLVQWHNTVLSKLALVPQKIMNSYYKSGKPTDAQYEDGDFVVTLRGCERITSNTHTGKTACEDYAGELYKSFKDKL